MSVDQSLSVRGFKLASILDKRHGSLELVLKVLDLENDLSETKEALRNALEKIKRGLDSEELPESVQLSEFSDDEGYLKNPPDERTWIESLSLATKLDVRAILSTLPTELGLYPFLFVHKKGDKMLYARVKVWVVPAVASEGKDA
jgi:hypothetical protein